MSKKQKEAAIAIRLAAICKNKKQFTLAVAFAQNPKGGVR